MNARNRLYCADCLEVMREIAPDSVDLVLVDPPYGTTACSWDAVIPLKPMWDCLNFVTKKSSALVFTASQPFTSVLVCSNISSFKCDWVWEKTKSGSPFLAKIMPMRKHESILVFSNGGGKTTYNPRMTFDGIPYVRNRKKGHSEYRKNDHKYGAKGGVTSINDGSRYPTSIQKFSQNWRRQDQVHPTQKPVELMEYLIETYSNFGETVLDFTMGSGTTGVAAMNTGRKFVGIEMDNGYFDVAKKRIEKAEKENDWVELV